MAKLTLLLAFHNHQPDGNFDSVFEQGFADCYAPLLRTLLEFPRVRCALHYTGPLLEWIERNYPDHLGEIRTLVSRGQVELLGGGFYEPMLAVLPERDALGQLAMMGDFCERHFGVRPRGIWLAERVWEPGLPDLLARAGVAYTLLDDTHFRYAGMEGELRGHYVTEKAGRALALFPIERRLRYAIPFYEPDRAMQTLEELRAAAPGGADAAVTYGDDGEKFGMWPGTKAWVWEKGWLREFFRRLTEEAERRGAIQTSTFSDQLASTRASGRVYLPTASYEEMGEWALPAEAQKHYLDLRHRLEERGELEAARPFLRGGIWQGFLAKYPEANFLHKKMTLVSDKLARAEERPGDADRARLAQARRELYRAQCNCAYWHGLFGGLYLNYLRHAIYRHLIEAELVADQALGTLGATTAESRDLDADLEPEVALTGPELVAYVKPGHGGGIYELDVRRTRFNLANVVARHREGYHEKLRALVQGGGAPAAAAPRSIHDLTEVKDARLAELLSYDRHLRLCFIDHFLAPGAGTDALAHGDDCDLGDFAGAPYEVVQLGQTPGVAAHAANAGEAHVTLRRRGSVRVPGASARPVLVEKSFRLSGSRLDAAYRIEMPEGGPLAVRFAPELSLTLLAGDDPGRYYRVPRADLAVEHGLDRPEGRRLSSRGEIPGLEAIELVDEWSRMAVSLAFAPQVALIRYPLETASQSEGGFERTYQGSTLVPVFATVLSPGVPFETKVSIAVRDL